MNSRRNYKFIEITLDLRPGLHVRYFAEFLIRPHSKEPDHPLTVSKFKHIGYKQDKVITTMGIRPLDDPT